MELVLIRHGRSVADDEDVIEGGGYDAPLSEEGRRQARLLAERLVQEGFRFDILFASPLRRAREVAEIVGGALGTQPTFDDRLREIHTGRLAGVKPSEAEKINPTPPGGHRAYVPIPGGESTLDHYARTLEFGLELLDKRMDKSVCVVAHGGSVANLLRIIYGMPIVTPFSTKGNFFAHSDTGISRLTIRGPHDVLTHYLNDESHLRGAQPRIRR